jgi:hypothetical protein
MIIRKIVAMVAFTLAWVTCSGAVGAITISPGQSIRRDIGSMTIDATVGKEHANVTVAVKLRGELVAERVLMPGSAEYRFAVASGGDSARGVLRLVLAAAPQISSLDAEITCMPAGNAPVGFTGSIATWLAPDNQIWFDTTMALTPDLFARTTVSGPNRTDVMVTLLAGSVTMYTVSVNQVSPVAVIRDSLVLGDLRVAAGATFTMTIPTSEQRGMMFMQALFQSRDIPPTPISAAIANWP